VWDGGVSPVVLADQIAGPGDFILEHQRAVIEISLGVAVFMMVAISF
jgi:hypothetical protein